MGLTGTPDDDTAAGRLHALAAHYRQHPVTSPEGHSYIGSGPRPTRTAPAAPVNLTVVDHIAASVREIVDHTREVNPDASPLPPRVEAVYAWYLENTKTAEAAEQQRRDAIVYRQKLEHAIAMGEYKVVRPHRCPKCRCFGLFWRPEMQAAVCTNGRCLDKDGLSNRWTLARLAYEHVAAKKSLRARAT